MKKMNHLQEFTTNECVKSTLLFVDGVQKPKYNDYLLTSVQLCGASPCTMFFI